MYSFDIQNNQYHRFAKMLDREERINHNFDRSIRSVFPLQMAENITSTLNYQTSIFNYANDKVMYPKKQFNWTEVDMIFLQKDEIPVRTDYKYNVSDPGIDRIGCQGNYTYNVDIPSWNRLYHYPTLLKQYTVKQSLIPGE